jgi:hypothetical protein
MGALPLGNGFIYLRLGFGRLDIATDVLRRNNEINRVWLKPVDSGTIMA